MEIEFYRGIFGFRLANEARGLSHRTINWYQKNQLLFQKWVEEKVHHKPMLE